MRLWLMLLACPVLAFMFGSIVIDAWNSGILVIPKGRWIHSHTIPRAGEPWLFLLCLVVLALLAMVMALGTLLAVAALLGKAPARSAKALEAQFASWDRNTPTQWHPAWLLVIAAAVAGIVYVAA